mmetsp:Transcript_56195/g.100110  ORF Transcript_56195/g.100110 Transcript_56195/m.100110 type:complete len:402 (-) Transcript_56195:38-1243(-)|eukprot:CAMPEP_0197647092 /NCGR_PEP_ID=MMETSP1338-20131121/24142_1 /TAXON_ID=43686 ORGANISM="Pelagodinium beii, Strain RCC1491" /NCGR_SAMPLE_ID=MMETSP1338 /ASSEMBLY_ACC=CAM_ASM_000754 /LENGTH=401 /DNA_ID=CAMNT_0043220801 /DNA_START=66 /DNA_END=1271 /DNA_ORIENTATION=+
MPVQWEVIGGADKGGILVRKGQDLKSEQLSDRLSTGALVEELKLVGDRLHYKRSTGTGPEEGWVSLKVSGKELLVKKGDSAGGEAPANGAATNGSSAGPGDSAGSVELDTALKSKIEADAKAKQSEGALQLYCMKYKVLGFPLDKPKFRVLCFHNAGSTESCYTGPGTDFIKWIKETKQVELMAFDYPGRDKLLKAKPLTSTETLVPDLMAVAYEKLTDGVPYIVWGHSVGTWVGFEFLMLARKIGLPMPKAAFFVAFPAPHMPEAKRPWRVNSKLSSDQMKEEVMAWDKGHFTGAGKVVFEEPMWKETWEPMMRGDFKLFDEYKFTHEGAPKFDFPLHCWWCDKENYIKQDMVKMWGDWTTSTFDHQVLDAGHLTAFYNPQSKKEYFEKVTKLMKSYSGL